MIGYVFQNLLQEEPFIGFTVVTHDGSSYPIDDPAFVRTQSDHLEIWDRPYSPDGLGIPVVIIPYTGISKIVKS